MALKPTIYKVDLQIVDLNRNVYPSVKLTLALHPSELPERMMVRLLAYALNYHEDLEFCKGLSAADEADLWQVAPTQEIMEWIEVGQVSPDRLRKAVSRAANIKLYATEASQKYGGNVFRKTLLGCQKLRFTDLSMRRLKYLFRGLIVR